MKRALFLFFLLGFTSNYAQETFKFESKIHPEKKYNLIMQTSSLSDIHYSSKNGNLSDVLGKPTKSQDSTKIVRLTITDKANEKGEFRATMKILEARSGKAKEVFSKLPNTTIYGLFKKEVFLVDSIINLRLDSQTKNAIVAAFGSTKPDIDFPKKPLKVGDSFKHKVPVIFPINGKQISFTIIKTYTLKSVKGNIAYFDLSQEYNLKDMMDADATGTGNGYVEFDIKENQIVKDVSNSTLDMEMDNDSMITKIRMKITYEKITTIE